MSTIEIIFINKAVEKEVNRKFMENILQSTQKSSQGIKFIDNCVRRLSMKETKLGGALLYSLHHFDLETGVARQKRADRRLNIIRLLEVMIPQIELETFAWGQWFVNHKGECDFYTRGIDYLKNKTGMCERTVIRALEDLQKRGYLKVNRREAIGKSGKEMRIFSLRKFTNKFFIEMGFKKDTIVKIKSWKRKKNDRLFTGKKLTQTCKSGLGKLKDVMSKIATRTKGNTSTFIQPFRKPTPVPQTSHKQLSPRDTQNYMFKASELAKATGRCPLEVYKELIAKL